MEILNNISILDTLEKLVEKYGKPRKVIFFTYTLDTNFLENRVIPILQNGSVDRLNFELEIFYGTGYNGHNLYGIKFERVSLDSKGIFHPKVYYFEWDNKTITFIGSGNLTNKGWDSNKEIFFKTTDERAIKLINYLKDIIKSNSHNRINFKFKLEEVTVIIGGKGKSIINKFFDLSKIGKRKKSDELMIVSPFFDEAGKFYNDDKKESFLSELISKCKDVKNVSIFLPAVKNINDEWEVNADKTIFKPFSKATFYCVDNSKGYLHAKLYAFSIKKEKKWHLLFGSPNCTSAAMYGKNIEVACYWKTNYLNLSKLLFAKKVDFKDINFNKPEYKNIENYNPIKEAIVKKNKKIKIKFNLKYSLQNTDIYILEENGKKILYSNREKYRKNLKPYLEAVDKKNRKKKVFVPLYFEEPLIQYIDDSTEGDLNIDPLLKLGSLNIKKTELSSREEFKKSNSSKNNTNYKGYQDNLDYEKKIKDLMDKIEWIKDLFNPEKQLSDNEINYQLGLIYEVWKNYIKKVEDESNDVYNRCWYKWVSAEICSTLKEIESMKLGKKSLKYIINKIKANKNIINKIPEFPKLKCKSK